MSKEETLHVIDIKELKEFLVELKTEVKSLDKSADFKSGSAFTCDMIIDHCDEILKELLNRSPFLN